MLDHKSKQKLNRLIDTKSFRFIAVLYEDTNDIVDVKAFIKELFPLEKAITLHTEKSDYQSLSPTLYNSSNTFIYIDDFEALLKEKKLYEGFNQRRDKLSKYPINLIVFYPKAIQDTLYRDALKYIADLWEFKNGIVELADSNEEKATLSDVPTKAISSLGGITKQSKEEERLRLELSLKNATSQELKANIFGQLGVIAFDLGRLTKALEYLEKSLEIRVEIGDKSGEGTTLNNISQIYKARGDLTKALEYLEKSLKIVVEIGDKSGECSSRFNIGHIHLANDEVKKAHAEWITVYEIAKEIEYAQALGALDGLAKGFGFENFEMFKEKTP
jgi:tetratricopeptide (TPR) repeat protein